MSFHTDAMDAVNAFVAVRNSMKQDSKDVYYDWLLKNDPAYQIAQAKKEQEKRDKANAAAAAAGQPAVPAPAPVTAGGVNAPMGGAPALPPPQQPLSGGFGAISTTPNSGTIQGQQSYFPNRGGVIPSFQAGGMSVDPETGALSPEQIMQIRQLAAAEEARQQRPAPQAIDPGLLNRGSIAGGYDPRPPEAATVAAAARYGQAPDEATLGQGNPSSAVGRALAGPQPEVPSYAKDIEALYRDRAALDPGLLTATTPAQRAAVQQQQAEIDKRIETLRSPSVVGPVRTPTAPTAPTQTNPVTPQPPPTSAGGAPTQPPPAQAGQTPDEADAYARNRRVAPGVGAPPGTATEPPPGSIPPPGGTGGGGGPGGGVGRRSGGRPKLGDQSRREAYDPTADAADPGNVAPVFTGGAVNPVQYAKIQDAANSFDKALSGGVNFAEFLTRRGENHPHSEPSRLALHAGVGAMPVASAQAAVAAWDMGGKLKPPDALVRYMMGTYEILLERGQTAAANQMAFEVIQRLNLEAARHGATAMQQIRTGDIAGATKTVQDGHRWSPDGKSLQISPDGKYVGMVDQFTGKPTSPPIPVTPKSILAAALSLSDGTGMWNHLASRAQLYLQTQKGTTDKDAEGRALRNVNTRYRGEILRRKLDAPPKVGGAVGPPPVMGQFRQVAGTTPRSGGKTTIIQGDATDADAMREETVRDDDE